MRGKTNVPEFGYSGVEHKSVFPTTRGPCDTSLTPNGYSVGPAEFKLGRQGERG